MDLQSPASEALPAPDEPEGANPKMWPLSTDECYVSIDIEADGRIPGRNSMLSLGAAALTSEGKRHDSFSVNLEQLPEATEDIATMRWWAAHSAAWEACRTNPEAPEAAIQRFHAWLERQHTAVGWPVMVGYPVAFDAMWVQWYLHRFVGEDPFRRRAIDIKTLAMVAMGSGYRPTMRTNLPKHWLPRARHTHVAVDDAIEQGELFMNLVRELNVQRGDVALAAPIGTGRRERGDRRRRR